MLDHFRRFAFEWRRVPGVELAKVRAIEFIDDQSDPQRIVACDAPRRLVLRRTPEGSGDPNAVEVFIHRAKRIGQLPADAAAEMAPLLDSGRTTFDAEIWSVEEVTVEDGRKQLACTIALTRFELVPVGRFDWTLALAAAARETRTSAKWTGESSTNVLKWLGRFTFAVWRSAIVKTVG